MSTTQPSQGTHVSDGIRTGTIWGSIYTAGANPATPSTMTPSPVDTQPHGVFNTPTALFDSAIGTVRTGNIAAAATLGAAGYFTLVTVTGAGVTVLTYQGITGVLQLDVPRNVVVTSSGGSAASNITVFGWDQYGMPMVEQINSGGGAATTAGLKAFTYIRAVYSSAGTVANYAIGVGKVIGLPYYIANGNYVFSQNFDGALDVGTIVVGDRTAATAATGDIRGTYAIGGTPNDVRILTLNIYAAGGDARKTGTAPYVDETGLFGVAQYNVALF